MLDDLFRLVRLQDLDHLIEAYADPERRKLERGMGFKVGKRAVLRQQREELAATISPALVGRYTRLRGRHSRAVVLLRDGICLGCFVRCPSSVVALCRVIANTCESCGRILVVPRGRGPTPSAHAEAPSFAARLLASP